MRHIYRLIAVLVCTSAGCLVVSPFALYCFGLSGIEGRPQKPPHLASVETQSLAWKRARGDGVPHVEADNPYAYAISFFFTPDQRASAGHLVTWWVASDFLAKQKGGKNMGWWHLSGAALAIWLSRNWTSEEILSAASYLRLAG